MMALADGPVVEALDSLDCWRALGEAVPDLLFIVDAEGTILHANRGTSSRRVDDLLGGDVFGLAPAELRDELTESLANIFEHGESQGREFQIQRSDTRMAWYSTHAGPVRQASDIVAALIIVRDITSHRLLESHLYATQRLETFGHLAGGVAHDINSILAIILISTKLLGERVVDEMSQFEIGAIVDAAKRGETLTEQLLRFARHERPELERRNLNAVVHECSRMFERVLGSKVEVRVSLEAGNAWVRAGRGQLEQILMNLVLNARDAIPHWGRIIISTRLFNGPTVKGVALAVEDTGVGMDDITRRRAFEPLFTTKGPEKGTGLGLSTVQAIANQLGGTVSVRSELNVGTTIEVILPTVEAPRDHMAD